MANTRLFSSSSSLHAPCAPEAQDQRGCRFLPTAAKMIFLTIPALAFVTFLAPTRVVAQTESVRAAVVLDGQELFRVRGVKAFSAETRAQNISEKLKKVGDDHSRSLQSLSVIDDGVSTDVIVGETILFSVLDTDARAEGTTRQELGRALAQNVTRAIEQLADTFLIAETAGR